MGTSSLPKGAIIELREQGRWVPYEITDANTTWHTGVSWDIVPQGTPIHRCVWKKDNLEVRRVTPKATPATKTRAQWQAECKARMDSHIAQQMTLRKNFDAVIAELENENDPLEVMSAFLNALKSGRL
jgi:hypothetical protein